MIDNEDFKKWHRIKIAEITGEEIKKKNRIGSDKRIRTYNYPRRQVIDHRLKKSWDELDLIMDGNLDKIIRDLQNQYGGRMEK